MSRKTVTALVVAGVTLGAIVGSLAPDAIDRPAMAQEEQARVRDVVWSGPPRNVNYRVLGQDLQKAVHVDEITQYDNLLVFRDGQEIRAAVSLYALLNFQVVAPE